MDARDQLKDRLCNLGKRCCPGPRCRWQREGKKWRDSRDIQRALKIALISLQESRALGFWILRDPANWSEEGVKQLPVESRRCQNQKGHLYPNLFALPCFRFAVGPEVGLGTRPRGRIAGLVGGEAADLLNFLEVLY